MRIVVARRGGGMGLVMLASAVLALCGALAAGGDPGGGGRVVAAPLAPATPVPADRWSTDLAVSMLTDDVYVAFELNRTIERLQFTGVGAPRGTWRAPVVLPSYDVAVNGTRGDTYEAIVRPQLEVLHQSPKGNLLHQWKTGFVGRATDLSIDDASNELAVGILGSLGVDVHLLSQSGDNLTLHQMTSTTLADPHTAVATDTRRNVFAAGRVPPGGGKVQAFDDDGTKLAEWALAGIPVGIVVGRDGPVIISEQPGALRGTVERFAPGGEPQGSWPIAGRPLDVDVGPNDDVYVTVQRTPGLDIAVEHYTAEGRLLLRWTALSRLFLPTVARP
jgi:hypothetical protein